MAEHTEDHMAQDQPHTDDHSHDHSDGGDHSDCEAAVSHLWDYLAGELDDVSMTTVTTHLERCSPCLEAFDFHAELKKVVAHKCSESMPSDLRSKLLEIAEGSGDPSGSA